MASSPADDPITAISNKLEVINKAFNSRSSDINRLASRVTILENAISSPAPTPAPTPAPAQDFTRALEDMERKITEQFASRLVSCVNSLKGEIAELNDNMNAEIADFRKDFEAEVIRNQDLRTEIAVTRDIVEDYNGIIAAQAARIRLLEDEILHSREARRPSPTPGPDPTPRSTPVTHDELYEDYLVGSWEQIVSQANVDAFAQALLGTGEYKALPQPADAYAARALPWLQENAHSDKYAAWLLANYLEKGKGIAKDLVQAVHYYSIAANSGVSPAEYRLGVMYEQGRGVDRNLQLAAHWYERAADQGLPLAQLRYALFLIAGETVPRDTVRAKALLLAASKVGLAKADEALRTQFPGADHMLSTIA